MDENIPRSGTIEQKPRNQHDFCYKCSKDGPEFLFGNLRIGDEKNEPFIPSKQLM